MKPVLDTLCHRVLPSASPGYRALTTDTVRRGVTRHRRLWFPTAMTGCAPRMTICLTRSFHGRLSLTLHNMYRDWLYVSLTLINNVS